MDTDQANKVKIPEIVSWKHISQRCLCNSVEKALSFLTDMLMKLKYSQKARNNEMSINSGLDK